MGGIGVVGQGDLDDVVAAAPGGSNGISPAGTGLEGLLGNEDTILLDLSHRKVSVNDNGEQREVHLTPTEFNLLEYLMMHAGEVVSYEEISNKVWGYDQLDKALQNNIKKYVNRLREKLGDNPHNPIYIKNIPGFGYRFIGAQKHATDEVTLGSEESIILYPSSREVYVNSDGKPKEVHLTPTEFNLLEYLMRNADKIVSYEEISNKVLGYDQLDKALQDNIRDCVNRLRKKLGDSHHNPIYIENIYGFGYRFIGAQNKR